MELKVGLAAFVLLAAVSVLAQPEQPSAVSTPAGADYQVGPEDILEVFVWKEPDLSTTAMVRPDGKISLPLLGELEASGKTAIELQGEIAGKLRQYVEPAVVNVVIKEVNSPKISILGEVHRPDRYKIRQRVTVLDAIALAGGFTEFANRSEVIVIRSGPQGMQRIKLNLKRLLKEGDGDLFYLQSSDTVYVE